MKNINDIVKLELCNGCGTCFSICPNNAIDINIDDEKGILFAEVDNTKCTNCGLCLKVCPSLDINTHSILARNKLLGDYIALYYGFSLDDKLRYKASSGGIVSSLFKYLLENNIVDGVVLIRPTSGSPFIYEPFITAAIHDIYELAGTRYFPTPMNKILKKLLTIEGKFVIVGTPCQIYAISKFSTFHKELRKKIFIKVGLFCGGTPNINSHKYLLYAYDIDAKNLVSIYRGIGWPGYNVLVYKTGKKVLIHRRPKNFVAKAYHSLCFFPIFAQKKCLLCVDRFASYADISVGDAWLDKFKGDKKGTSLIIVRNREVAEILQAMKEKKYIFYDKVSEKDVINSQKIFSCFYNYFHTMYSLFKETHNILNIGIAVKNKINYRWLILMALVKIGMSLARRKYLWRLLFLYVILFNIFRSLIDISYRLAK
ncbi:MAG: Coenzyme F420 hydrogenase/dehydrogenase, beta subunit C-terminal domain [Ignisphaera sp.]